jgi:hypothetical protein
LLLLPGVGTPVCGDQTTSPAAKARRGFPFSDCLRYCRVGFFSVAFQGAKGQIGEPLLNLVAAPFRFAANDSAAWKLASAHPFPDRGIRTANDGENFAFAK